MYEAVSDLAGMPKINLFGIAVLEPFTVLTNLLIALACFIAYYGLKKHYSSPSFSQKSLLLFFLLIGWATIIGGVVGHAFLYATGLYGKIPGWYTSMAGVVAFERSVIAQSRSLMNQSVGRFFSVLNIVEVLTFMTLSFATLNFAFVEAHAAYGLFVVVFCFELYVYSKTKNNSFRYIALATLFGLMAALCHAFKISINYWFNYNDVSHLFMVVAILFYYKAALLMKNYETTVEENYSTE